MRPEAVLLAFIVLISILVFIMPMVLTKKSEGFSSGISFYDRFTNNQKGYDEQGGKKYNPFASMQDVTVRNFAQAETDKKIDTVSKKLRDALSTSEIVVDPTSKTFEGVKLNTPALGVAPMNRVVMEAKKCEAINSRDSCSILDDPKKANCGICVKGRSTMFKNPNDKYKQGGLLVLPEDRRNAVASHGSKRGPVKYTPTVGNCPAGYLFVDSKACQKEVNRLNCLETGQKGGFNGGLTSEGKDVISSCAAAPVAGSDVFVYDKKDRSFDVNLRVLTPSGTGITKVYVVDKKSGNQIGYASQEVPGVAFTVLVRGVKEAQAVDVTVVQEIAYRSKGKAEVFQYIVDTTSKSWPGYNQTIATSKNVCARIGARSATDAELQQAWSDGAQACSCGNTQSTCAFPSQASLQGCGSNGLNTCSGWNSGYGHSWCYGVKPPQTSNQQWFTQVMPWFNTYGERSAPSQEPKPNIWSKWGSDYQAPAYRAVILQWEHASDATRMAQPFEPSITAVNDIGPSSVTSEGLKTFKVLRRFGTFRNSNVITSPRPVPGSPVVTTQFWIWGNKSDSQTVKFSAQIPGTFLTPFYDEDVATVPRGQLVTKSETYKLLQISPCMKEGQAAGKYSIACLSNLFVGSGGDISRGKLVTNGNVNPYDGTTGNGLNDLNKIGDMDEISAFLDNLYIVATTGRDSEGNVVGGSNKEAHAGAVNMAAQLMFGFDITTPCEDVQEDNQGNIVIVPKSGTLDSNCLLWLWQNTGADKDRGSTDPTRTAAPHKGGILNTYTTIKDRYSGLRYNEATPLQRKVAPFQTCQLTGTAAPVNEMNVARANAKGSLKNIQDWYDSIHKAANYEGTSKDSDNMKKHSDAVAQCYGVNKAPEKEDKSCNDIVSSYVPVQNKIIGKAEMSGDYTLTFKINPKGTVGTWANIIRFQKAPGGFGDCCDFGLRSPAIWFFPGSLNLHVRIGDQTDGNWGIDTDPIPMGVPTTFKLECVGREVSVTINNRVYRATQPSRRYTGKMTVYGSDPWYPAALAEITELKYTPN